MLSTNKAITPLAALSLAAIVTACSGGGGGAINPPPGGGNPSPTPTPALVGSLNVVSGGTGYANATYTGAAAVSVDFSCGCTSVAGSAVTDGSGNFMLVAKSTPIPIGTPTPNPMYTIVPGRNYLIAANAAGVPQAFTMQFAGSRPSHDQYLNPGSPLVAAPSDVFSAAVALYVFQYSPRATNTAYDDWNFNALLGWYNTLKNGSPTPHEATLLNDIVTESNASHTLWPSAPSWRPGLASNATIRGDLAAIHTDGTAVDATLPTPCPSTGCTGTPTP